MSHADLLERLHRLRRRIRQIVVLYGVSWITTVGLSLLLVIGWTDWRFHLDDSGTRLLLGLTITGLTGWVAYRRLLAPLRTELSDLELALKIERRYPSFRDSLVSTVQFLTSSSADLGSQALQERVIRRTMRQLEGLEFDEVVHTRSVNRMALMALLLLVTAGFVVGLNQAAAATAIQRLMFPFSPHPWPRQTRLQFITAEGEVITATESDPLRIAKGETLELYVVNVQQRGLIPADLRVELQDGAGRISRQTAQRTTLRGDQGAVREVALLSHSIHEPVRFRAVGGDDREMEWSFLDVVPPPVVQELQLELIPPQYTGRPPLKLAPGVGHVEGLVGTRVQITARSNKPLQLAQISLKDQIRIPLSLATDQHGLTGSFPLQEPGVYSYWLDLRDLQNFGNQAAPRYEIRAQQDTVPVIDIEVPETDRQVTSTAEVPLRFLARDDLGLKQVRILYARLGDSGPESSTTIELPPLSERPQRQSIEYLWKLADLKFEPGTQIQLYAEATDDYDLGEPHVGRSLSRTLTIVTAEQKQKELSEQEEALHAQLETALKLQTEVETQTAVLEQQLQKAGEFRQADLDQLQRLEQQQRQVAGQLQQAQTGVSETARKLREEAQRNQLAAPDFEQRLGQVQDLVRNLGEQHLPQIEDALQQARRLTHGQRPATPMPTPPEGPPATPPESAAPDTTNPSTTEPAPTVPPTETTAPTPAAALQQAKQHQQAVREQLGELTRELDQWQDQQKVQTDLQDIREAQTRLNDETATLSRETITKPFAELTRQQQADLARQAERQQIQARQLDQLQQRMEKLQQELGEQSPAAAERVQQALEELLEQGVAGKMRDAARQLSENNVGQAVRTQQDVQSQLDALDGTLRNRSEDNPEQLLKQLEQTESQLQQAIAEQVELLKKHQELQQSGGDSPAEQEQLGLLKQQIQQQQQAVADLLKRLRKTPAEQARAALQDAAQRLEKLAQQTQAAMPEEGFDPAAEQQEILEDLQQAQQDVEQLQQELQEQLAAEQLEKSADQLRALVVRQQGVIDETKRLEQLRTETGNWTRAQLKSLRDLSELEQGLMADTKSLAEKVQQSPALQHALELAARELDAAAQRLGTRLTDLVTLRHAESARDQIAEIVQILGQKSEPMNSGGPPEEQAPGEQPAAGGPPPSDDVITLIAELKLLKAMQVQLNRRREELAAQPPTETGGTDESGAGWKLLADDQKTLADLLANYAEKANRLRPEQEAPPDSEPEVTEPPPTDRKPPPEPPRTPPDPDAIQPE